MVERFVWPVSTIWLLRNRPNKTFPGSAQTLREVIAAMRNSHNVCLIDSFSKNSFFPLRTIIGYVKKALPIG